MKIILTICLVIGILAVLVGCGVERTPPCKIDGSNVQDCAMIMPNYNDPELKGTAELRSKAHLELIRQLELRVLVIEAEIAVMKALKDTPPSVRENNHGWAVLPR